MYVVNSGLSWLSHPYLYSEEGEIQSREHINLIIAEGFEEVFIDSSKGSYQGDYKDIQSTDANIHNAVDLFTKERVAQINEAVQKRTPIEQELGVARKLYSDALDLAHSFINDARAGTQLDFEKSEAFVDDVIDSVSRNADALVSLSKLRSFDEYTYTHSINVAVLTLAFAKHLNLDENVLKPLGISALFHDLGKSKIPGEVLNKPGKLTDKEFEIIKLHPMMGRKILEEQTKLDEHILRGVAEHHEKYNGKGYPLGLPKDDISLFASLITVADVYDALTSDRVYKEGMPPSKALGIMYSMREQDFFPQHMEHFIKCVGIYPVGSFVKLSNGELAVVSASNPHSPLFPVVRVIFDEKQRSAVAREVDLAAMKRALEKGREPLKILENIDPDEFRVNPADYLL